MQATRMQCGILFFLSIIFFSVASVHQDNKSCAYNEGEGIWLYPAPRENATWDRAGKYQRSTGDPNCPFQDFVTLLQNPEFSMRPRKPIVIIGDSLDEHVGRFVCAKLDVTNFTWNDHPQDYGNKAGENYKTVGKCGNGAFAFYFFKIFGMSYACRNSGYLRKEESRLDYSTASRLTNILPMDIGHGFGLDFNEVGAIVVSSSLWDMSDGCIETPKASQEYLELYRNGIKTNHALLRKMFPRSKFYWRTGWPVFGGYSILNEKRKCGRTRHNQILLNKVLRKTVEELNTKTIPEDQSFIPINESTNLSGHHAINDPIHLLVSQSKKRKKPRRKEKQKREGKKRVQSKPDTIIDLWKFVATGRYRWIQKEDYWDGTKHPAEDPSLAWANLLFNVWHEDGIF